MKDKAAKKRRQRAKRKAKSKAFFERIKCRPKTTTEYFNKSLWNVDKLVRSETAKKAIGFDTKAWTVGIG
jgi:hypothetical protein